MRSQNEPRTPPPTPPPQVVHIPRSWPPASAALSALATSGPPYTTGPLSPLGDLTETVISDDATFSRIAKALLHSVASEIPQPSAAAWMTTFTVAHARHASAAGRLDAGGWRALARRSWVLDAHEFGNLRGSAAFGLNLISARAEARATPPPLSAILMFCALYLAEPVLWTKAAAASTSGSPDGTAGTLMSPLTFVGLEQPWQLDVGGLSAEALAISELRLAHGRTHPIGSTMRHGGIYDLGGRVDGVILVADEEGRLSDAALWIVRPNRHPAGLTALQREQRRVIAGDLRRSEWASQVRTLATAVADRNLWEPLGKL